MPIGPRPAIYYVAGRNPGDAHQRSHLWWRYDLRSAIEDARRIGGTVYFAGLDGTLRDLDLAA